MPSLFDAFKQYIGDAKPGGLLNPEVPPGGPTELAKGLLGFTPVVGDAISGYDAIQSARQGDYLGAALNGVGLLPFVPSMGGVVAKGNFPEILYRGTTGSTERIKGGIGEGLLFAAKDEPTAKLYGQIIEKIGVHPDANILIEGNKEFSKVTKRRQGKIINNMRKGENLKSASDDVIEKAKLAGYDAVDFNSMKDIGVAILNPEKFVRNSR